LHLDPCLIFHACFLLIDFISWKDAEIRNYKQYNQGINLDFFFSLKTTAVFHGSHASTDHFTEKQSPAPQGLKTGCSQKLCSPQALQVEQ